MTKQFLALIVLTLGVFVSPSFAQTTVNEAPLPSPSSQPVRIPPALERAGTLQARPNIAAELLQDVKARRMQAKEEMQAAREVFQTRLQEITDVKRKGTVERIDTRLTAANDKHTERLAQNLEGLSSILEKVSSKAATLENEGVDTTALQNAITDAEVKIDTAKTALSEQAGKEYVLEITDETMLRETISPVVAEFRGDIKAAYQAVVDSKTAVVLAATQLKALMSTQ